MLEICNLFFENINTRKIRYCHWKSNGHLEKALNGITDLDVLVHQHDKKEFEAALQKYDFKRILSPKEKQFPGMADYLGFDFSTGAFVHLHLHYKLVLGQKFIKNHHLPIENLVFENLTKKNNVFIPSPEMELILLIIRAHMKVDLISLIKHVIKDLGGHVYSAFPSDIEEEFRDLIAQSDLEKLKHLLQQSGLPLAEGLLLNFITHFQGGQVSPYNIARTRYKIHSSLKEYRRNKEFSIHLKYLYLLVCDFPVISRFTRTTKKTLVNEGRAFSLVGADGSGKSTLVNELEDWLAWKLSVRKYYLGIPKTKYCNFISYCIWRFSKFRLKFFVFLTESYMWIYIAKKRYTTSLLIEKDIRQGKVVITDRFPMKHFDSMPDPMDGPRLKKYSSRMGRYFSKIESNYYKRIKKTNCIFVLQVDIDNLRSRKTDLDISTHTMKANAVNAINQNNQIILIDANKPYADVKLEIKRNIWALLL